MGSLQRPYKDKVQYKKPMQMMVKFHELSFDLLPHPTFFTDLVLSDFFFGVIEEFDN